MITFGLIVAYLLMGMFCVYLVICLNEHFNMVYPRELKENRFLAMLLLFWPIVMVAFLMRYLIMFIDKFFGWVGIPFVAYFNWLRKKYEI